MNIKKFSIGFIITYLLISLPAIFGIGYVIDWIPEATILQKTKGYVIYGLSKNMLIKIGLSVILSAILNIFISNRKAKYNKYHKI